MSSTTNATAITTVVGSTRRVSFQIPAAISVASPTNYAVAVSGTTSTGTTFASGNTSTVVVNPPPAIQSLTPSTATAGQTVSVTINTIWTNFVQGATAASFGPGISVGGAAEGAFGPVTVISPTSATANIVVNGSTSGFHTVTVRTGIQAASVDNTFSVTPLTQPTNQPPSVNAGNYQPITLPDGLSLSGTASDDGLPQGSTLTTTWSKTSGPGTVTFGNASSLSTTATFDQAGSYVLRLTATDSVFAPFSETTITVNPTPPTNQPPSVSAGTYQPITLPSGLSLNGTASDDGLPQGSTLTTTWSKTSGPGTVTFANAASLSTTATFDQAGTYVLRLTATDSVFSPFSETTITVNPAPPTNHAPVANAGGPYSGSTGAQVSFDGSASTDADNDSLTYSWNFGDSTTGSGPKPTHTYSVADAFTVTLTVTDGHGGSDTKTAIATIAQTNRPPVVSVGGPYNGDAGSPIALAAIASDPDRDPLTFNWDYGDGHSETAGASPTHTFDTQGTFTITVTVSDGRGGVTPATGSAVIGPPVDRIPPTIMLTAPTTTLPGTQPVVTADAKDNVGVASVTFDVTGASSSQKTQTPYDRVVDVPALATPGSKITVKGTARDAANNVASAEATITIVAAPDTTPPVVALQLPPTASPGSTIVVTATAFDEGGVQSVTFSSAGVPFGTDTSSPYSASFVVPADTAPGTTVSFLAHAVDFANNPGEASGSVSIIAAADTTPPSVSLTAPASIVEGSILHLSATASDNVRVASVDFIVDDVPVGTVLNTPDRAPNAPYSFDFHPGRSAGSVLRVRAVARDAANNPATSDAQTRVLAASAGGAGVVTGQVYNDATGLPVAGAQVTLSGKNSNGQPYSASTTTDGRGQYFAQGQTGTVLLQITRDGFSRVDRLVTVSDSVAVPAFDARLTPLTEAATSVPAIGGGTVGGVDAALVIAPGGLSNDAALRLTRISAQGLEGLTPLGWSVAGSLDIAPHGVAFTGNQALSIANTTNLPVSTVLLLAMWDESAFGWRAVATTTVDGDGSRLAGAIGQSGQFAWLVPDVTPTAPPQPSSGDLVGGVASIDVPDVVTTEIIPQPRVVFYKPGAVYSVGGLVRASLPSGTPLRSRISEAYHFNSGDDYAPDPFVQDLVFYRRPGPSNTDSGSFVVSPSLTFDPADLQQGVISIELHVPGAQAKPLADATGGTAATPNGETIDVPPNAVSTPTPIDLQTLTADQLGLSLPPSLVFVGGLAVGFSGATPTLPSVLSIAKPVDLDPLTPVVLVRLATVQGVTRFLLVGSGRVVGTRIISDRTIPGVATVLDGVNGAGRYAFLRGAQGLGFAAGTVYGSSGSPLAAALVTTSGLPIVAVPRANGAYVVPMALGAGAVSALDVQRLDRTSASITVAASGVIVPADLRLQALTLTVSSLTPTDGAASVPLSSAVVATFSQAIDPQSVTNTSFVVTGPGGAVAGTLTLSSGNTRATFRANQLLAANGAYTVSLSTAIKDVAGRALSSAVTAHFTSLDTSAPPAPPAGSIVATIPDGNGFTTVTGTQGSAALHDTVSIVNLTKKTSFPALVAPNGSFSATFLVSLGDKLQVAITDQSGNQTVVKLPAFTRTNPDGSQATVVGSDGGRITGPGGTAVDVPAGAFPDGTIVTIATIDEASFPTQLTPEQKQFFAFGGGIRLDFGGATPNQYLNVSIPATGNESPEDRWIVGQIVTVNGSPVLNVVDTARVIQGRITTSSPPCPGVQAAAAYGMFKSTQRGVGVNYGRFSAPIDPFQALLAQISQPLFGAGASMVNLPYQLIATPTPVDVCIPILSGRVTVQPNTQKIVIDADQFTPRDRQIVVRNTSLKRTFYFPRNVAEFRFVVQGSTADTYTVTVVSPSGTEADAPFKVGSAPTGGSVSVNLDISALNESVATVVIQNVTRGTSNSFAQSSAATAIAVAGGSGDSFDVTVVDQDGIDRSVPYTLQSPTGAGNLIARALPATIDPLDVTDQTGATVHNADVYFDRLLVTATDVQVIETHQFTASELQVGGFTYPFNGNPETETFRVRVVYADGRPIDVLSIPNVAIAISNPVTGRVIKTLNVLAPPQDEPFNLGNISGDESAPMLLSTPPLLNSFDPSSLLTFQFTEGVDRNSAIAGLQVTDINGKAVAGEVRLTNENKTVTFVPDAPLKMASRYTVTLQGITDGSGNEMAATVLNISTFTPSRTGQPFTAAGAMKMLRYLTLVKKDNGSGGKRTLGFGVTGDVSGDRYGVILDLTEPENPQLLSTIANNDLARITVLTDVQGLTLRDANPCGGGTSFSGDLAIVSAGANVGTAVRFFDVTDPTAPCFMGAKLLTLNPAFSQGDEGVVVADLAFPRGVAGLIQDDRIKSFTAIENVGLMRVDVGNAIPTVLPRDRVREQMASGSYADVLAINDRLFAIDRGTGSLDIFDASLAQLSDTKLPLNDAIALAYADAVPFDVDGNGQITQDELVNLVFVGGTGGIAIVDVTDLSSPTVLGTVPSNGIVWQVEFDADKRRLFASGLTSQPNGEWAVWAIDLSGPRPFSPVDEDGDGRDDRIVWQTPAGLYPLGTSGYRALRFDPETRILYTGVATDATGTGGFETWSFDNICCDLSLDFHADVLAEPSAQSGDRDALLLRERKALQIGITAGLNDAASCGVPISTTTPAVKGSGKLAILEQGSGACLWRLVKPDGSIDSDACGANYQPGLSDHDFEVFMPIDYFNGKVGDRPADCVVNKLSAQFINTDKTPKEIDVGGSKVSFDDITFFPFRKEGFDNAELDLELPQNKDGDTLGDLAMGRQNLLLLWLLGGDYVDLSAYNVVGEPLDSVMETFKRDTHISRVEGYEWANLQRFNLLKSKAFIRITGASKSTSIFHDLYVKQLHDAAKAAIRTAFARMVADETANSLVLDVRRTATSPGTGFSYRDNACVNLPTADPITWEYTKPCAGFEEYVLSAAARTVTAGLTIFTADQVFNQIQRFWRVKADVRVIPDDIATETDADRFLAEVSNFIGGADAPGGDVDPIAGVVADTKPIYYTFIGADPRSAQRTVNLQKVQEKIGSASKGVSLHIVPHVLNQGFSDATQVEVSMYRAVAGGGTTRVRTVVPNDPNKPDDPLRIDLAHDTDSFLRTGPDIALPNEVDDVSPEERNLNDLARHEASNKTPLFAIGDPRWKPEPGKPADPNADPNNPLINLTPSAPQAIAFTFDLPDKPASPKQKEGNRQNNFEGFYFYVLDRASPAAAPTGKVPFPGSDPSVLDPDLQCTAPPDFTVTQSMTVRGSTFTSEVNMLPNETGALTFTVTNPTAKPLSNVQACSTLTNTCHPIGNVGAGSSGTATASFTAPKDATVLSGLVTASSLESGVRSGTPLTVFVGCETYTVAPLDPDANPDLPGLPNTSVVEQGGYAYRYYRVVDRYTGLPLAGAPVIAVLEIPGATPVQLTFTTDADGIVTTPGESGMKIAYPAGVAPGVTGKVRVTEINGVAGYCAADATFDLLLKERVFTSSIAAGASLEVEGKLEGVNLTDKGAFAMSGTLNSGTSGDKALVFGRSLSNTTKAGFKAKTGQEIDLGFEGSVKAEASANAVSVLMTTDSHTFPLPLSTDNLLALGGLAVSTAYEAPLSTIPAGPILFRIINEVFERVTGLDSTRTQVGISSALGVEAGALVKPLNLTLDKADNLNGDIKSTLGISVGAQGSTDAAIVLSGDVLPKEVPPILSAGIEYRGQVSWKVGANLALQHELAKDIKDSLLTYKEIVDKFEKSLKFVESLLNTTGTLAGGLKFSLDIDAKNVKLKRINFTISQRKQYGWTILNGTPVNQGDALMRRVTYTITDRDPAKMDKAIQQLLLVQAALVTTGIAGPLLSDVLVGPDFLSEQLATLISYADTYEATAEQGKGVPIPFGLSKLLKGTPYEKDFGGEVAINFDSLTKYTYERGVVRRGGMFPHEKYDVPDPLVKDTAGDKVLDAIAKAKSVVESIADGLKTLTTYVDKAVQEIEHHFSPSGVKLTVDGTAEPVTPLQIDLFAFKYEQLPPELVPLVQDPADVAGDVTRPHYGIGGFFQFVPGDYQLAAPAPLTITYLDSEVANLDESSLAIYRWNDDAHDWDLVGGTVDLANNTVTTTVTQLGLFSVGARMPSGTIEFTASLDAPIDLTKPTTATFTSAPIYMNTGELVPDGTLFSVYTIVDDATVLAQLGTIVTPDADPNTVGVQVQSHNGTIQFVVTFPAGTTQPRVVGFAPSGTAYGSQLIFLQQ